MRLTELAGEDFHVARDGNFENLGFASACKPAMLTFAESEAYLTQALTNDNVTCVITTASLASRIDRQVGLLTSQSPGDTFFAIHNALAQRGFYGKHESNHIHPSARIDPRAIVAERGIVIGAACHIEAGAIILPGTHLGDECVIRAGAVIGGEGFQFRRTEQGTVLAVVHAGGVWLGDRVEIQQNSCIDRALFGGHTLIGDDSKIDNLCTISHEARLGSRVLVGANTMIAGSAIIEDDVWIGPHSCISNGVCVGKGAMVSLGSVVVRNVAPGKRVTGNFAIDHETFIRNLKASVS